MKISNVKNPIEFNIINDQKEIPAETASALNLGDDSCILNRIN